MKKVIVILAALLLAAAAGFGGWLWYDANVDRSGWDTENQAVVYRDFYGDKVTLWQDIDGQRYYFGEDGILRSGWLDWNGNRYWLGFTGELQTGWQEIENLRYFFADDGSMVTGWQEIGGNLHRFAGDGTLVTGWLELEGNRYYLDENGCPMTGTVTVEGIPYRFREDGTLVTGWLENCYYFADGTQAFGWQEIDGQTYCFGDDGRMLTGWLEEGEYRYYLKEDGTMAVGPCDIDGKTYYFTPAGIHLWLVNPWVELHEDYEVELEEVVAGYRIAAVCVDAFNRMMEDCKAAGLNPELLSGYRTYWDQQALYAEKVAEYGVAAGSQIVARPNTSEHQLGYAVDIVNSGMYTLNKTQGSTRVQQWLMEHCWDYGFILRYPEGTTDITGIIYEPWHYRYVGLEVALEMKELGITLEEYLGAVPN